MRIFFTILFPFFILSVYSESLFNDLASKASDAGPLLKNLLDKDKLADIGSKVADAGPFLKNQLGDIGSKVGDAGPLLKKLLDKDKLGDLGSKVGDILKGSSSSGSLNDDLAKMQFMMMMLKALQNSVDTAKNQNKTGFLNAENFASIFEIIQKYKNFFPPPQEEPKDASSSGDTKAQADDFLKNLLAGITEKSLNSSEDAIDEAFAKNLLEEMLKGAAQEELAADNEAGNQNGQPGDQKFSLSDLNNLMNTMKELNNTIDRNQLKDLADSFKEYFSEPQGEEGRGGEEFLEEPKNYEGINTGLVVIVTIMGSILLVIFLIMVRRCYKKRKYLASRMTEHRPLHSVSSEKVQI